MIIHANGQKVTGVESAGVECPACHSKMIKRSCPCPFRRKGWATCARCINKRCGKIVGLKRRPGK